MSFALFKSGGFSLSDCVIKKPLREGPIFFLAEACQVGPFYSEIKSLEGAFPWENPWLGHPNGLWPSDRFSNQGLFPKFIHSNQSFPAYFSFPVSDSNGGSTDFIKTFQSPRKTPEAFLGWGSQGNLETIWSLKEYFGFEKKEAGNDLQESLNFCLSDSPAPSPDLQTKEQRAVARQTFIQSLAVHIAEPEAMDRFITIMEGLLGDEPDEKNWQQLYDQFFGWSKEELSEVDDSSFFEEEIIAKNLGKDASVSERLMKDPEASGYLAGLILRVESLYGTTDPEFVDEYKAYVTLTLSKLGAENQFFGLLTLQSHLRTPEDYRVRGFLNLPERPAKALSGTEFMQEVLGVDLEEFKKNPRQLGKLSRVDRENAILQQIEMGNIPDFLRRPKPLTIKGLEGGEVTTYVMPDYIAIGSDKNFVRIPLSPILAQALASKYNLALPTKTIVEETYRQAGKRVVGPSYSHADEFEQNSAFLDSPGFYLRSSKDIDAQLKGLKPGTLVAGGKKELVVSPFVAVRTTWAKADESIAFYGLFDSRGIPAQRTPGHGGEMGYRHTEYALGVRFLSPMIVVRDSSGQTRVTTMNEGLQDPEVAKIISRVERTYDQPETRVPLMDGPFDPSTCYQQKIPKGQKEPQGPRA
jgi:hypothetical protein